MQSRYEQARKIQQLSSRLYSRLPLLGGWFQRRAVRKLAQEASPAAFRALAQAIGPQMDLSARRSALEALGRAENLHQVNAICQAWSKTRSPELAQLIASRGWAAGSPVDIRVLSALLSNRLALLAESAVPPEQAAEMVGALVQALADDDTRLRLRARACLGQLKQAGVVDAFCLLWAETRQPLLEEILLEAGYVAGGPPQARALSAIKTGNTAALQQDGDEIVPALAAACRDRDGFVVEQAGQALASLQNSLAQESACRAFLEDDNPVLQAAVLKGGYLPKDSTQRALFLFLTGQWEAYTLIDFDHQILSTLYQSADAPLRERIKNQVRQAGRAEFLPIISGPNVRLRLRSMDAADFKIMVQVLSERQEWERLWALIVELPPALGISVVQRLAAQGWQPQAGDEQKIFQQLVAQASEPALKASQEIDHYLPPAVLRARVHLLHGRINDLAFSPKRSLLALGTSRRKILLWDYRQAAVGGVLNRFEHSIGKVAYTSQDVLLAAERTNAQAPCSVYACHENGSQQIGTAAVIYTANGSITELGTTPADQDRDNQGSKGLRDYVLVAARDRSVALLDLGGEVRGAGRSSPKILKTVKFAFWPRGACISASQQHAALLHQGVTVIELPSLKRIGQGSDKRLPGTVRSAAFFADGMGLFAGKYNGEVLAMQTRSLELQNELVARHTGSVEGIAALRRHPVVITAGAEGTLQFIPWDYSQAAVNPALKTYATTEQNIGPQITSLHITPDEAFMAVSQADSTLTFWDLRVLDLPELFNRPLGLAAPRQMPVIAALIEGNNLPRGVVEALKFVHLVLQFRFRFDIEIDALVDIKFGEYDIEIE